MMVPGWQKLREGTKGLRRKGWTFTKILSPNIRCFAAIVAIYALFFEDIGQRSAFLGETQCLFGQEVHYYMVYIA